MMMTFRSKRKNYGPSEHQMQAAYFEWVRLMRNSDERYKNIFAVPNGAWLAGGASGPNRFANASKMKKEGLEPGVPDIIVAFPVSPFCGAALELKRKPNKVSEQQFDWLRRLSSAGWYCMVCWSQDELIKHTEDYLGGKHDRKAHERT